VSRSVERFRFMDWNSVCCSYVFHACCIPCSSHYPLMIIIYGKEDKLWSSSSWRFIHFLITSFLLVQIFSTALCCLTPLVYVLHKMWDTLFYIGVL
jgi:hypothetical protein